MPFYRGQLLQGFINNNMNLEINEDKDEMFPQQKVQVISQSQLSNGFKNHQTIFNGTYSTAFVEYVVIFCKQRLFFRESDININLKFKIEPIIRFKNNFDLKGINKKRNHREKKQEQISKVSEQQEDSKNAKNGRKSTRSNFNGKSSPKNDEDIDRDNSQYHGRRCFCCSNRSPPQSELTLSRSYSRSPMNKIPSTQIQERKNKLSNFPNEKRVSSNFKNQKINAIQRGKSSQSDRKQKSSNLYFNNHLQTSNNQQQESSSYKAPNKIQFRNLHKRRQNETCSESNNKWVKTKRQDDAFSRTSQYEQDKKTQPKTNLHAKKRQDIKITRNPFRQTSNNQTSSNPFFRSTTLEGDQKNNLNQIKSAKTSFIHIAKQMEQRFSQMGAAVGFDESENQRKLNFQSKTGRINESKKYHHQRKSSLEDGETNILTHTNDHQTHSKVKPQVPCVRKNQGFQGQNKQESKIAQIKQYSESRNSRHGLFQQQKPSSGASKIRKIPLNQKMQMIKQMQAIKANENQQEEVPKMKKDSKKPAQLKEKEQQSKLLMKRQSQQIINGFKFKENKQVYQSKQIQIEDQPQNQKSNDENQQKPMEGYQKPQDNENDFSITHQRVNEQHLQLYRSGSKFNDQSANMRQDDLASTRKQIKYESHEEEDGLTQYEVVLPVNIHQVRENASTHTSRTIPYNSNQLQNHLAMQNSPPNHKIQKQDEQQFFDELFMNGLEEEPQQTSEDKMGKNNEFSMRQQNSKAAVSSKDFINSQTILQVNKQLPISRRNLPALSLNSELTSEQKSQYSETSKLKVGQENHGKSSKSRMSINSFQSFPPNQQKILHSSETEIVKREQKLKDQCSSQPCKSFESLQRFEKQLFQQQLIETASSKKLQKSQSYKLNKATMKDCLRLDTIDEVNESIYRKNERQLSKDSISLNSSKIGSPILGPGSNLKQATSFTQIKEQALFKSQNHNSLPKKQSSPLAHAVQCVTPLINNTTQQNYQQFQQQKSKRLCDESESCKQNKKQGENKLLKPIVNENNKETNKQIEKNEQDIAVSVNNNIQRNQDSKNQQSENLVKSTNLRQNHQKSQETIYNPKSKSSWVKYSSKENISADDKIKQDVSQNLTYQPNKKGLVANSRQQRPSNSKDSNTKIQTLQSNELSQVNKNQQIFLVNKQNNLTHTQSGEKQLSNCLQAQTTALEESKNIQYRIDEANTDSPSKRLDDHRQIGQVCIPRQNKQTSQQLGIERNQTILQNYLPLSEKPLSTEQKCNSQEVEQEQSIFNQKQLEEELRIQEENTKNHKNEIIQQKQIHQQKYDGSQKVKLNNQSFQPMQSIHRQIKPAIAQKVYAQHFDNKNITLDKKKILQVNHLETSQQDGKSILAKQLIESPAVQTNRGAINEVENIKKNYDIQSKAENADEKVQNMIQKTIKPNQIEILPQLQKESLFKNQETISEKVSKPVKTLIASAEVQTDYFLPIDNQGDSLELNKQEVQTNKISSVHSEKKKCKINLCEPQIFNPNISESHSPKNKKVGAALKRKNRNIIDKKNDVHAIPSKTVQQADQIIEKTDQLKSQNREKRNEMVKNTKLGERSPLQSKKSQDKNSLQEKNEQQCLEQIQNIFKDKQQEKISHIDQIQKLHLNFEDSLRLNIDSKNPQILNRLIYKKFNSMLFQVGQIISEGKQKKLQVINNSLQFIRRNLSWLESELINEAKTQACLFINNQWILFTPKQKSQCLDLALLLLVNLQQASVYRCIQMLTGMPIRILKDKQRSSDNKRLLKSVNALLQKRSEQSLQKAYYGINKMNNQIVLLQKVRHFLDKQKQNKTILECMRINLSNKSQIFNIESQSISQFVQMFVLQDPKYLLLELDKDVINTYQIELDSVIFYISGHYKFNLYEETQRNQYKLVQQSYMWIKHKNEKILTKYLLVIEPMPNKQGQSALTMRLATSSKQGSKTNRIVKYESGGESKQFKGGYENKKNLYLPVVKEISKKAK